MGLVTIDHTTCAKDGLCGDVCPVGLFDTNTEGFPVFRAGGEQICFDCGHCVAICPSSALQHERLPLAQSSAIDRTLKVSLPALDQLMESRRSVREFKTEPVPQALIHQTIEVARWAPTAVNRQPLSWLVIQNPAEVQRLAGLVVDALRQDADLPPRYAAFVQMWDQGMDPVLRKAPHLVVVHGPDDWAWCAEDGAIALSQFELAAAARGMGTCWAGFLMHIAKVYPPLKAALGLPEGHSVCGALMLGMPKYRYQRIPPRNPAKVEWR